MSHGLPLAVLIGTISLSEGALAADDAPLMCVDISAPKAMVGRRVTAAGPSSATPSGNSYAASA